MRPMAKSLNAFRATLLIGWMALCVTGVLYARIRGVPSWAAAPALAAFLVEYAFYLVPAFTTVRERVAGWRLPAFLVASAVLPSRALCGRALAWLWLAVARLTAPVGGLGRWSFVAPPAAPSDFRFGAL